MNTLTQQAVGSLDQAHGANLDERVSELMGFLTGRVADATKAADDMVRASPWRAVAAVVLAGIAAGILVSRRPSRSDPHDAGRGREVLSEVTGG